MGRRGKRDGGSRTTCTACRGGAVRGSTTSRELRVIGLAMAAIGLFLWATGVPLDGLAGVLPAGAATGWALIAGAGLRRRRKCGCRARTVLVGSSSSLDALKRELAFAGIERYALVGRVTSGDCAADDPSALGRLEDLRDVVVCHAIDLVLMTPEVSRAAVFDAMAHSCVDLPVRLWDLSGFYEDTFGYVPLAEINAAWFQCILHPRYRPPNPLVKRAFDIAFAIGLGLLTLPLVLVLMALIRRDGGRALFRQTRIGERGRPFAMHKLRTMTATQDAEPRWCPANDPRVTRIGWWLRRTHLDELPQLWNILRGEMTVVGPRPEQPGFVRQLEGEFPFYNRRHQLRPGLTGWAQARCGYVGSSDETAWKLSHDLYYLRHRSHWMDFLIVLETARHVVSGRQYNDPRSVPFVTSSPSAPPVLDPAVPELGPAIGP
jgi:exopolysaccharide biosynthesis polyprenyl glycosylphosphotransferase